jgi:hypothetical protein
VRAGFHARDGASGRLAQLYHGFLTIT